MKLPMSLSLAAILGFGSLVPTIAEAKSKDHHDYNKYKSSSHHDHHKHRQAKRVKVWVRGHFEWHRGHRHWVPGHYEWRPVYYWR